MDQSHRASSRSFHVLVRSAGQTLFVAISGEIDIATADILHGTVVHVLEEDRNIRFVVFDFADVSFLDARGIRNLSTSNIGFEPGEARSQ